MIAMVRRWSLAWRSNDVYWPGMHCDIKMCHRAVSVLQVTQHRSIGLATFTSSKSAKVSIEDRRDGVDLRVAKCGQFAEGSQCTQYMHVLMSGV